MTEITRSSVMNFLKTNLKKLVFFLFLVVGALLFHVNTPATEQFELRWTIKQRDVPALVAAPVAIANNGKLIALEYRELNPDDNHMYAKVAIWNVATGEREKVVAGRQDNLIESQSFDGYLIAKIEQSQPLYSEDGLKLGTARTTSASKAHVTAKSIFYNDPETSNTIQIRGSSDIDVDLGHKKPLIRLSLDGKFLAIIMENQVEILRSKTGERFQFLPISSEAGQTILAFFFDLQGETHFAVVCKEETQIWMLKRIRP
jgi:hypothetical protein